MAEKFTIAICTLGHNPNLETCLDLLVKVKNQSSQDIQLLLVINNVPNQKKYDSNIKVVFEPVKGYSSARNKALFEVERNSSIIFIDDDEFPSHEWFNALVEKHNQYPMDIIFGPVFPLPNNIAGSYRDQFSEKFGKLNDGDVAKQAGAGNMLIPSGLLESQRITFDLAYNSTGGEDTDLCFRVRKYGTEIRFAKKAIIYEIQSPDKYEPLYLEKRFIKDISVYSVIVRRHASRKQKVKRFLILCLRIISFSIRSIFRHEAIFYRNAYYKSLQSLITGKFIQG